MNEKINPAQGTRFHNLRSALQAYRQAISHVSEGNISQNDFDNLKKYALKNDTLVQASVLFSIDNGEHIEVLDSYQKIYFH